ncbi:uncharacterized protein LOC134846423 [Symsagittifera roscoffensis]|uniref:uncharacterized protein LOC134846423 n=1 Tax=Symsagittifera roscoffensis TaxID=84072 RepID=UPI00307C57CA
MTFYVTATGNFVFNWLVDSSGPAAGQKATHNVVVSISPLPNSFVGPNPSQVKYLAGNLEIKLKPWPQTTYNIEYWVNAPDMGGLSSARRQLIYVHASFTLAGYFDDSAFVDECPNNVPVRLAIAGDPDHDQVKFFDGTRTTAAEIVVGEELAATCNSPDRYSISILDGSQTTHVFHVQLCNTATNYYGPLTQIQMNAAFSHPAASSITFCANPHTGQNGELASKVSLEFKNPSLTTLCEGLFSSTTSSGSYRCLNPVCRPPICPGDFSSSYRLSLTMTNGGQWDIKDEIRVTVGSSELVMCLSNKQSITEATPIHDATFSEDGVCETKNKG